MIENRNFLTTYSERLLRKISGENFNGVQNKRKSAVIPLCKLRSIMDQYAYKLDLPDNFSEFFLYRNTRMCNEQFVYYQL
jgi:hypothetical protein